MELAMSWNYPQYHGAVCWIGLPRMDDSEHQEWSGLVRRVRAGEEAAQRELVERLWPRVAARAARWCPRNSEIEDLAQEVFLKVFTRLWQFRGGNFPAWVDRITRGVCYDALRRQRVRPEWRYADLEDFDEHGVEDDSAPPARRIEARRIVSELLAQMPTEQAWLIREVEIHERSIGEISLEMGWTEVAGRLRLLRARRSLHRIYQKWNED
jgi:RNA polymerase sigma-70 factor (ECF subfamily)